MENDNSITHTPTTTAAISSVQHDELHITNIQLLASIDCALALLTLIFDIRQVIIVAVDGVPKETELSLHVKRADDDDDIFQVRLITAAVASVGLTLAQLLLACLVMVSLSNVRLIVNHVKREQDGTVQRRTIIISGIWTVWSTVLLMVLIAYALSIRQFEDFGNKFYLFMLVSEIVLRIGIIFYTCFFFWCRCFK